MNNSLAWDREYKQQGIVSSWRAEPSAYLKEYIEANNLPPGVVLDLGCGKGRNSKYMSSLDWIVHAIDLSGTAVETVRSENILNLYLQQGDLTKPWPFETASADLALDMFVLLDIQPGYTEHYAAELARCLKPGGTFLTAFPDPKDGYYGQFPVDHFLGDGCVVISDPNSETQVTLPTPDFMEKLLGRNFSLAQASVRQEENSMYGKPYPRLLHNMAFTRR